MKNAWRSRGAGAALIVVLTVLAYIPVLRCGFVYDDHELITENQMIQASDGLYRFWFTSESADYRPLAWSLWWGEWRLWDGRPLGYHVVNVLLHAVNAVLVWAILRQLKIPGAWLAAMVFAIHPVIVATVGWISEQKNTLSMLFYALAILLYLRFDEEERLPETSGRSWCWYGSSLVAFFLALLSKTAVVMLPVVLLGCVWWRHGRVRGRDWLCSVPYFAASLVLSLVTIVQHQRALPESFQRPEGFMARLLMAGWVPWFYLYKALLPMGLTVIYPKWGTDPTRLVFYVPGMVLLGVLVILWQKRATWGRPLLFGLGYFLVMLFPVMGFFDQGFYYCTLVADHWQYYSIIGVIALAVAAAQRVGDRIGEQRRYLGMVAGVAVLVALGVATWKRVGVYTDEETLWRDNAAKNPNAWAAHNNLGAALQRVGQSQEAIFHYEEALRIKPDLAMVHNNFGIVLGQAGKIDDAIRHYEQALRIKPDYDDAHYNLGNALRQEGKTKEAIEHYEEALRIKRDYAEVHYNLGVTLWEAGRLQDAIDHYEQALRFKPGLAEAHNSFGIALERLGRATEAIGHWEQALRIKPDYAEVHGNWGVALERAGRIQEAINHYEEALRLKPQFAEAQYNLGGALVRLGQVPEAIGHWEQALQINPDYAEAHNNLGSALIGLGRVQEGIGHLERALRIKADYPEAHNNLGAALIRLGRVPEAIEHYEQVLRMKPDSAEAHNNLASALAQDGRVREAAERYERALRLKPDYAEARNNLAWLLATRAPAEGGDPVRAVTLAQRACELTGNRAAPYLDTLAVAYAATGHFADAIATAQKAIELAQSARRPQLAEEINARLELYRRGRAYQQSADTPRPGQP